jgi:L-alanine-DL-glutamate epimerase-like enolase superfamily enzyme
MGREEAVRNIEQLAKLGVWAIEEPLRKADPPETIHGFLNRRLVLDDEHWKTYQWLRDRSAIPLIADENLICPQTARNIIDYKAFDILNVRLSKCGGTHLSGEVIQIARPRVLDFLVVPWWVRLLFSLQ